VEANVVPEQVFRAWFRQQAEARFASDDRDRAAKSRAIARVQAAIKAMGTGMS